MKTKNTNQKGLQSRAEQSSAAPKLDFEQRRQNRQLPTKELLELVRKQSPGFWLMVEVVGQWVWIQFKEVQPPQVTTALSQLGFHWNSKRQLWQHPCGTSTLESSVYDPRRRYGSFFPARSTAN